MEIPSDLKVAGPFALQQPRCDASFHLRMLIFWGTSEDLGDNPGLEQAAQVYLVQARPDISMDEETQSKIYSLLRDTYPIWLRSSIVSREARQAVKHLGILLGLQGEVKAPAPLLFEDNAEAGFDATQFESPSNMMPFDQFAWEAYQGEKLNKERNTNYLSTWFFCFLLIPNGVHHLMPGANNHRMSR